VSRPRARVVFGPVSAWPGALQQAALRRGMAATEWCFRVGVVPRILEIRYSTSLAGLEGNRAGKEILTKRGRTSSCGAQGEKSKWNEPPMMR